MKAEKTRKFVNAVWNAIGDYITKLTGWVCLADVLDELDKLEHQARIGRAIQKAFDDIEYDVVLIAANVSKSGKFLPFAEFKTEQGLLEWAEQE